MDFFMFKIGFASIFLRIYFDVEKCLKEITSYEKIFKIQWNLTSINISVLTWIERVINL